MDVPAPAPITSSKVEVPALHQTLTTLSRYGDETAKILERITDFNDRVLGAEPIEPGEEMVNPAFPGVIGEIQGKAAYIERNLRALDHQISRLNKVG